MASGDEAAWRAFLASHGRLIYALAGRFAARGIDRDDLFQEACLRVLQSVRHLEDPDRLASWVYTITYRLGVDAVRRQRPESAELEERPAQGVESDPEAALVRLEAVARLMDALAHLGQRCRSLLQALYLDEDQPSYAEIASRQKMPIGSIGPTRARCLEKLKKLLEGLSNGPPSASS